MAPILLLTLSKFEQTNWFVLSGNHWKNTGLFSNEFLQNDIYSPIQKHSNIMTFLPRRDICLFVCIIVFYLHYFSFNIAYIHPVVNNKVLHWVSLRNIYNQTSFIPKITNTMSNDNLNNIKNCECAVLCKKMKIPEKTC